MFPGTILFPVLHTIDSSLMRFLPSPFALVDFRKLNFPPEITDS